MLGNHLDADEVTQEVLIVMYDKLETFKYDSSLFTWIYSITTRRCLNYIKKRNVKRFFSIESEEVADRKSEDDIVKNYEDREKLNKLDKILEQLPARQREVFILRNFEELSYNEISKITGKSVGGLKANYFHALKKIMEKSNEG
jgi:RNA polymerase sigma-70 factor (ECF subfamily)